MNDESRRIAPAGDEYLDLVDTDDEVIGYMLRSQVYAEGLSNFRVVNAFIVNREGKIWIPRRTSNKRVFPLCLDMSMGGHVESGETYEQAFRRETSEELNIDIDQISWRALGLVTPHEHGISAFSMVYEMRLDEVPHFNPDDYLEYFWLSPQELLDQLRAGEKSKDDLPRLVKIFYRV